MIDICEDLFVRYRLQVNLKACGREVKIKQLETLVKNCRTEKNYKFFFSVNFRYARLLYKKADSLDTTSLQNTNKALKVLNDAQNALDRADKAAQKAQAKFEFEHEKEEKVTELKAALDTMQNIYQAQYSINEADDLKREVDEETKEPEAEEFLDIFEDAIQHLTRGLTFADNAQDDLLRSHIHFKLGFIY